VSELAGLSNDCIVTPPTFEGFREGLLAMLHNLACGATSEVAVRAAYEQRYGLPGREKAWLDYLTAGPASV
jgi:hypothetical protein